MFDALKPAVEMVLAALLALLIHEYGHITVALLCGVPVKKLAFSWRGCYIRREYARTPGLEILISASGPLANFIASLFFFPVPWFWSFNLVLGLTNLVPMAGSDGQRIMRAIRFMIHRRRVQARLDEIEAEIEAGRI